MLDFIVIQMSKVNHEKGYFEGTEKHVYSLIKFIKIQITIIRMSVIETMLYRHKSLFGLMVVLGVCYSAHRPRGGTIKRFWCRGVNRTSRKPLP